MGELRVDIRGGSAIVYSQSDLKVLAECARDDFASREEMVSAIYKARDELEKQQ